MHTALQAQRLTAGSVQPGANVVFDAPFFSEGEITYNSATGEFTINQVGTFVVQWLLCGQASRSTVGCVFGVRVASGDAIIGNAPVKTGETVGFAVVRVETAPVAVALVNESAAEVWYSPIAPVKSSIIVYRSSGLEHLVDGNTVGSLAGTGTYFDYVMGQYAVALGYLTHASGNYALAQGMDTTASGFASHAEGYNTTASGIAAHAEGGNTLATIDGAHAEGVGTVASGNASHAEGDHTTAQNLGDHAEGRYTTASGNSSHAENGYTQATAQYSHAEGTQTTSSGPSSHAEGVYTTTGGFMGAHIMGTYGDAEMEFSWFLANGLPSARGLAAKILTTGEAYIDQSWNGGGADYAELFESVDGTEIEPGFFVTFDDSDSEKIRIFHAQTDEYVLGVVSAAPAFLCNTGELRWHGKYQTDEWGRLLFQETQIPALMHEATGEVILPAYTQTKPMLHAEFDSAMPYVPRSKRPEWVPVGLLGKLRVRDDGSCTPGGYCRPNEAGIATASPDGYRVLKRTGPQQVLLLFR